MNFNKVILLGRLTRDPEMRYTQKGSAICNIGMAVSRQWKSESGEKKEEAAFVDCVAFGKTGEIVSQYCKKGGPLMIEGHLRTDTWDDKQTGQKRSKLVVVADNVQLIGSKQESSAPASKPTATPSTDTPPDDCPF